MSRATVAERGLPANTDAEKFILGSILLDGSRFASVAGAITEDKFALQKHRCIWARISDLAERGENIDRVTLADELMRRGELESVDGLTYLTSLDDGLPHIPNLDSYVRIIIEKHRLRRAIFAAQRTMTQALSGEFTADQVCLDGQAMLAEETGGYGSTDIESVRDYVTEFPGGVNALLTEELGVFTGFHQLDEWTSGFHPSEIFLFGARPGSGKTSLATCIAKNISMRGHGVAFFSLELTKKMLLGRIFTEHANLSYSRFRAGELTDDERRHLRTAMGEIMDIPLYIDDSMGLRVADIRVKLNKIIRQRSLSLLIVDYAQLIRAPKGARFSTENDRITAVCEDLKALCKDTNLPLLLLSQLNRESEKVKGDSRPKLSQARGGGAFEEICYVGGCLYREWITKPDREDLRNKCELIIDKNRSGRSGSITLSWTPWCMRFGNTETDPPHNAGNVRDPSTSDVPEHELAE